MIGDGGVDSFIRWLLKNDKNYDYKNNYFNDDK